MYSQFGVGHLLYLCCSSLVPLLYIICPPVVPLICFCSASQVPLVPPLFFKVTLLFLCLSPEDIGKIARCPREAHSCPS